MGDILDTTQRIFTIMKERGLSAYKVAKDTGISQGNFGDWKNGRTKPGLKTVRKLAAYFDVPVDFLLGTIDNPQGIVYLADESGEHYGISGLSKDEQELLLAQLEVIRRQQKRRENQE